MSSAMFSPVFSSTFSLDALNTWLTQLPSSPKGITADSRQVTPGMLFAALPGRLHDGRQFIGEAIARGAVGVLLEAGDSGEAVEKETVAAPHWRIRKLASCLGFIADAVYGQPSQHMALIGVTGTNGKTSCVHWIAQALHAHGTRAGVIGTLGNGLVEEKTWLPSLNTTPDAASLQNTLAQFCRQGADAVAMEVSSIGLEQGRVNGCRFDTALFTNLTRDHLDYHGTFESYAAVKTQLFAWPQLRHAIINLDDPMSGAMIAAARLQRAKVWRYSSNGNVYAEIAVTEVNDDAHEMRFTVRTPQGDGEVRSNLLGEFNRANVLGVLGVLLAQNVPLSQALPLLSMLIAPSGRLQRLGSEGQPVVVIDYAHTPDALERVLQALRATLKEGQRLFCVFGCGGDRDPGKRPLMGAIAAREADRVWATSDNPRSESPTAILAMIEEGLRSVNGAQWAVEVDRAIAIAQAIAAAHAGDVVLIAGKGHEPYQEIAGVRHPFLDADAAMQALKTWSAP